MAVPLVLGILNVTPDSFSDGGCFVDAATGTIDHARAIVYANAMLADGADMIDVGGESTRPGAEPIATEVEIERVVPIIEALRGRCEIAVDTRHAEVATAAVAAGATIINDVGASLWEVAADLDVGWIAMHMQGDPRSMQRRPSYRDVVSEVRDFLVERAETASAGGVSRLWIDPGFGFGKNLDHNVALMAHIDTFVATGWPVAIGTSRKSMLGQLIARSDGADQTAPVEDRLVGSVTTATYAMLHGVELIRAHDIKAAKQAATVVAGKGDQE